ncbi:MAG: glycoside hydrolase family 108 protein [Betaproteobacteria bacterium]|jgi:lysozyme family protein|nr:hypothetical protein [Burkholderiales bacterium]
MPTQSLANALAFTLRWEGGYVNHPNDRGGPTNKGVIQRVYDDWRRRQGQPPRDVRAIEDAEVHTIYETQYWVPPRCPLLGEPLDMVHFDTAVNMGAGRAVRFLQAAVGAAVDGAFGENTLRAVRAADLGTTLAAYCQRRENFYNAIVARDESQRVFLRGWMNRLNALRKAAGLPGYEAELPFDLGDTGYIARIPDVGEDARFDAMP